MKKKSFTLFCTVIFAAMILCSCVNNISNQNETEVQQNETYINNQEITSENTTELADGKYEAVFTTDSSMFHVNEANNGKGILTVENGNMTIHISLASTNIINLYSGTAEDAQKDGAVLLEHTNDTVTYEDGTSEEVYGFDIPVPAIDEEFDIALIGNKGKWYDHKVKVSDPVEVK